MITIEQLLESVDLDFEPRWVTKDTEQDVVIWAEKPTFTEGEYIDYWSACGKYITLERLKLAEFGNKDCPECIYEVPRKTTGVIEKFVVENDRCGNVEWWDVANKINAIVDVVNKHSDIIQQIGEWGNSKGECLWCKKLTSVNLGE